MEKKKKCSRKASKKAAANIDTEPTEAAEKKTRSPRFSIQETDHLLDLMALHKLNTQITNAMTPQARTKAWMEITRSFNAAAFVIVSVVFRMAFNSYFIFIIYFSRTCALQQCDTKALQERAHNIRTGLSKLCSFFKKNAAATGGGMLPPSDLPSVGFTMTDAVRRYAVALDVKLVGLAAHGDSDAAPKITARPKSPSMLYNHALYSPLLDDASAKYEDELRKEQGQVIVEDTQYIEEAAVVAANDIIIPETQAMANDESYDFQAATSSTPTQGGSNSNNNQFFPTESQRTRKRGASSKLYFGEKIDYVNCEKRYREEIHQLDVKLKEQMIRFWDTATQKLKANMVPMSAVLAAAHDVAVSGATAAIGSPLHPMQEHHAQCDDGHSAAAAAINAPDAPNTTGNVSFDFSRTCWFSAPIALSAPCVRGY